MKLKTLNDLLLEGKAEHNQIWVDDFGNHWVFNGSCRGVYWLNSTTGTGSIPYETCFLISLPGFHFSGGVYEEPETQGIARIIK